jgi:hypothetical protein
VKFYKTSYSIDEVGSNGKYKPGRPHWSSSASEASAKRTALKKEFKGADPTTTEHELGTTKAELLSFLNNSEALWPHA